MIPPSSLPLGTGFAPPCPREGLAIMTFSRPAHSLDSHPVRQEIPLPPKKMLISQEFLPFIMLHPLISAWDLD